MITKTKKNSKKLIFDKHRSHKRIEFQSSQYNLTDGYSKNGMWRVFPYKIFSELICFYPICIKKIDL